MKKKHEKHTKTNQSSPLLLQNSSHGIDFGAAENPKQTQAKQQTTHSIGVKIAYPGAVFPKMRNQKPGINIGKSGNQKKNRNK